MPSLRNIRIAQGATIAIVMYVAIQLALFLGVEEKSWLQRSWEILMGGGIGLFAGVAFFVVFGAIGWVSGPLFGGVGLIGLAAGGALGGLGLGALVNVIRDPDKYNISYPIVAGVVALGAVVATWLALLVAKKLYAMPATKGNAQPHHSSGEHQHGA